MDQPWPSRMWRYSFLGNVFEYVLDKRGGRLNILGATSGDTGSAAIAGVRGKQNINIFVMYPEGRTSCTSRKTDDDRSGRQRAESGH
ncbi:MAG: hypothetical protein ACNYPE_10520 [Candidatus Azotimanducaceae bacterium WSBS_2022_MAG_OTU7]